VHRIDDLAHRAIAVVALEDTRSRGVGDHEPVQPHRQSTG
jgi:hypothetical protein